MKTKRERSWNETFSATGVFTKYAYENEITDERRSRERRQQLIRRNHRTTVPRVRRVRRDTKISKDLEKFLPSFLDSKSFPTRSEPFERTEVHREPCHVAADAAAFIDRGRPWCLGARSSEKVDAACMDREESKYIRYTYIYYI